MKYTALLAFLSLAITSMAHANDFAAAADKMCEKMKTCSLEQMEKQKNLNPQMKQMMTQMVDQMCASMRQQYSPAVESHALYEPTVRCMESMAELDCAALEQGAKPQPCEELESLSK